MGGDGRESHTELAQSEYGARRYPGSRGRDSERWQALPGEGAAQHKCQVDRNRGSEEGSVQGDGTGVGRRSLQAEGRVMQRPGGIVVRKGQRACILLGPEGIFVRIQEADFGENEAQGQPRMALKPS